MHKSVSFTLQFAESSANELCSTVAYCCSLHLATGQLTFTPQAEEKYTDLLELHPQIEDTICTQVKEIASQLNLILPETLHLNFHESMEIAGASSRRHPTDSITARASPCYFGGPYFSNVAIQAEDAGDAPRDDYGKVLGFISFKTSSEGDMQVHRFAIIKYYAVCNVGQVGTIRNPFPVLRWWGTTDLVDVNNIMRLVHVIDRFPRVDMDKCY